MLFDARVEMGNGEFDASPFPLDTLLIILPQSGVDALDERGKPKERPL